MSKIKIKLVKSKIKTSKNQKLVLEALGLGKVNSVVEHEDNAVIAGMVEKVKHLVEVIK
ncbi:MAG: 50S ribosomal protein L30 [Paludibacteraceae bacterium]|jgi:large subunit ribosomal protein L30|nr:50S ribosomal protein L30 [Bacteroidales bacterium]MBO5001882.1 50S ribosomal protein L30 [Prevotella sp.]MBP3466956.1 50S ribosomal protein L30 [Paludibacteraceae bacterium]MBQ6962186.1 50S ribosomal protein L30 [Paludibacteraceae bacterium]MBQ7747476.1 50S ribosomal protein L30 [Paludibacteraceae bacterium]